ncbi:MULTISPECIES: hypothetical protein [Komagataeibacter]|uniref:Uncharacterized protein n=2 Tax=Komagataeibacter TaxID=1434011 RepID=A0A318QU72_9PROT|nr:MULTISPECIES: hypothetical protein [Komagataeibacter]GBR31479.1 hypothetical protein AA11826_0793 [Komagataeibacter oboediens DSM 11826]MBT0675426.1 hypothetical protein [Komagataeibacter oboediens]MCK9818975.1 hypothetical protein [Komagataeibacter oboediens]PYD80902.1 hypothetical protein CFR80_13095 [Komagataeibacter oboediens]WEQ51547.1 hypothetical protein LV478_13610 [Komagataeibacter oboediens]
MVLQQVFPNGHTPFHLNRGECLDPSAIRLAIDVCTKNNKFAVDVIYALLAEVDALNNRILSLAQDDRPRRSPCPIPEGNAG